MQITAPSFPTPFSRPKRNRVWLIGLNLIFLGAIVFIIFGPDATAFPAHWNLHLREPIDAFQSWVIGHRATHPLFVYFFNPFSAFIDARLRTLEAFLLILPWPVLILALGAVAYKAAGWRVALLTVVSLL